MLLWRLVANSRMFIQLPETLRALPRTPNHGEA